MEVVDLEVLGSRMASAAGRALALAAEERDGNAGCQSGREVRRTESVQSVAPWPSSSRCCLVVVVAVPLILSTGKSQHSLWPSSFCPFHITMRSKLHGGEFLDILNLSSFHLCTAQYINFSQNILLVYLPFKTAEGINFKNYLNTETILISSSSYTIYPEIKK
jgi:hypothetical protein